MIHQHQVINSRTTAIYIFAGLCASLVAIGLARFSYTPLLPELIHANWFSASDSAYLGAANLAGYLIGAIVGRPIAGVLSNKKTLRIMMFIVTIAFFGCAFPLSLGWFFTWRLLSGISGGVIMVVVASTVLPHVPTARRHLASGAIFLGIGLGVAASGTLVPLFMTMGLRETWIGLGIISVTLTAASWFAWPSDEIRSQKPTLSQDKKKPSRFNLAMRILFIQYALIAVGTVPAMVFLVDFISRSLGADPHTAAFLWSLYGLGAIIGPPLYGYLADKLGAHITLYIVLIVTAIATILLFNATDSIMIAMITIIMGTLPPGIVPLVLARIHELVPNDHDKQSRGWSRATVFYATFQALAGYAYSTLLSLNHDDHRMLFLIGGLALIIALILELGHMEWLKTLYKNLNSPIRVDS